MTLTIDRFREFFQALDSKNRHPFPWQERLAKRVFESGWPDCIDLPTASGKTACIDIAVFVAACQAELPAEQRTVGRRIFFTVNRRVIVDEAFLRSKSLAQKLLKAEAEDGGILHEVACALRSLNEESAPENAPPLAIAQLRGGVYRDATWARSITQPIVICTTVDQLGSRMLFRGFGVSDGALPIHAALCMHDATILLDEAHVSKAFCETLSLLCRYQSYRNESIGVGPPFRYVQMTATPYGQVDQPFQLQSDDFQNPVLKARQDASKPATLQTIEKKKSLVESISDGAIKIGTSGPRAVGIIVNRVQTARDIEAQIRCKLNENKLDCDVHLVIGRMRPIDRDKLQEDLREIVGPDRPNVLPKSVFVVSTQCLEVGADYDFDALLTECASIDALRQRFGRLNRAGRPITTEAAIYFQEPTEKGEDPIYGIAILETWNWLQKKKDSSSIVDFGIGEFKKLWSTVDTDAGDAMSSPSPHAAVLLPSHLDLLCQTSPRPTPEPEVGYFIHGPRRSNADVNVCWRADLGVEVRFWPDIVRLLPPTTLECMSVPIWTIRRWIAGQSIDKSREADVTVTEALEERRDVDKNLNPKTVLRWRGSGDQTITTSEASDIRPGDTIVIRVQDRGWNEFGHIPNAPSQEELANPQVEIDSKDEALLLRFNSIDVAETCCRTKNLRHIVRLHAAFPHRTKLRSLPMGELKSELVALSEREFEKLDEVTRNAIKDSIRRAIDRHRYPTPDSESLSDDELFDEVVYCRWLLPNQEQLELPSPDSDDIEDDRSQSSRPVCLADHTEHVVARVRSSTKKLGSRFETLFELAAQWHDLGKADLRFQAMLCGLTPSETMERGTKLAKSDFRRLTSTERQAIRRRSMLPDKFRHEFLSAQIVEHIILDGDKKFETDMDVVLRIIEAHHGYARPFADVVIDRLDSESAATNKSASSELRSVYVHKSSHWPEIELSGDDRDAFVPLHRLNSGVSERFWRLSRRFGWWGLAYLEAVLRLADQRASAAEERGENDI